jgi:dienelactone hydrolase
MIRSLLLFLLLGLLVLGSSSAQDKDKDNGDPLPGTKRLTLEGDIASHLVTGVDRFLLRELEESIARREKHWKRDFSSAEAYNRSVEPNRKRLAHILGVRDARVAQTEPLFVETPSQPALVGQGTGFQVFAVRWPAFADVNGEGLLLVPKGREPVADVVAVPDCNQLPEQLAGLVPGTPPESQYARRLAESGCRVLVPVLINRQERMPKLSNREWLYRSAFELGRGLIGYEVQKILAGVDWLAREGKGKIGVIGWGEGGLLALDAAALDPRIQAVVVSSYFDSRQNLWEEPIDRNVFGLLEQFGDAELASLVAPRTLIIEAAKGPEAVIPGGKGAPARVVTPRLETVKAELARARKLTDGLKAPSRWELVVSGDGTGPAGSPAALEAFLDSLASGSKLAASGEKPHSDYRKWDPAPRMERQIHELDRHSQELLRDSRALRDRTTMSRFDYSSAAAYEKSAIPVREFFYEEVIGRFPNKVLPANARTRKVYDRPKWVGYEVVMDVYPDVIAYGLLLLPKDLKEGERRPVVVCQHGLEGRPQDTIGEKGSEYYSAFAAKLAERGFVTFAPQNLYIFTDRFRTLQRKANPLKKSLFSIITPQHQQIVDWLKTQPFVDPKRIGFYGLSYGGKTAMRVPALVTDYALSICSADFNEWVDKNASTHNPRSYMGSGEYEIFEFDLGSTFNYAEMAALIAPRPFMVERGHFDGVADDWTVAHEYSRIRHLYAARLKIGDRTEIEWFVGPHKINGVGTYKFLERHLLR